MDPLSPPAWRGPHRRIELASYLLMGVALLAVLWLKLLAVLLAGLLVYTLVHGAAPLFARWLTGPRARMLVVALLGAIVVTLLILAVLGVSVLLRNELGNPERFWQEQLMPLVESARQQLPAMLTRSLPDSVDDLRTLALDLLHRHAARLQLAGRSAVRAFVHIVIGLVLGAIVALSRTRPAHQVGPLARALGERCRQLADAFRAIVFAQLKISVLNTVLTAAFLLGALPLLGIHVPLAKTLVLLTFVAGLLPVLGNLISNAAVTVAALSVSLWVGAAALGFLVVIHKLEYFLNARIVGTHIRASAWELLLAMLLLEALFGLPGVVAAPIYYACLKRELEREGLV